MTHEHYQKLISLYIDHVLVDRGSSKLFAHLSRCAECRSFLDSSLKLRRYIVEEPLTDVPASLDRSVLTDVNAAAATRSKWYAPVWFTRISIPLPAAVSIIFLIIVASLLFSPILAQPPQRQADIPAGLVSKIPSALQQLNAGK